MKNMSKITVVIAIVIAVAATIFLLTKYSQQADTLHYRGKVDYELLNQIQKFPSSKLKRIVIDSVGGEYPPALKIAKIIQDQKIQIVVDGYCLSACASIILPAGKDNIVTENSLIGFHNLPGVWVYLESYIEKKYKKSIKTMPIYEDSLKTIQLYENSGINPDLFIALTFGKGPICLDISGIAPRLNLKKNVSIEFLQDIYVPNRSFFEQFDWKFKELYLPESQEVAEKLAEPLRKNNPGLKLRMADKDFEFPSFFSGGDMEFRHFQEC
ncbi:hypothetical protein [Parasphingorhabdus sp.]|uniref:hypothetical protein n=1 Tax=Parasphingorhabdus sp. TaxID=2709688 RepID=UPI003A95598E